MTVPVVAERGSSWTSATGTGADVVVVAGVDAVAGGAACGAEGLRLTATSASVASAPAAPSVTKRGTRDDVARGDGASRGRFTDSGGCSENRGGSTGRATTLPRKRASTGGGAQRGRRGSGAGSTSSTSSRSTSCAGADEARRRAMWEASACDGLGARASSSGKDAAEARALDRRPFLSCCIWGSSCCSAASRHRPDGFALRAPESNPLRAARRANADEIAI